nr:hypothetical protein [Pantoea agglomerans]
MSVNILTSDEHTLIRRGIASMINSISASAMDGVSYNVIGDTDSPTELLPLLSGQRVNVPFLAFS